MESILYFIIKGTENCYQKFEQNNIRKEIHLKCGTNIFWRMLNSILKWSAFNEMNGDKAKEERNWISSLLGRIQ